MSNLLSLFTGYGGLDMAVTSLTGAELVAVSDIDKGPCTVLAHYHPDVPNLGDIRVIEWESVDVPDFDVLTGGYPCQPFSAAGQRKGTADPRHLWPYVLKAIKTRRPRHAYLENVRGHLSLGFDVVLTDLASAGYDVYWSIMAASSVGAAHRRERLYIYATPSLEGVPYVPELPKKLPVAGRLTSDGLVALTRVDEHLQTSIALLPTPLTRDRKGGANRQGGLSLGDIASLLPTQMASEHVPEWQSFRVDEWGVYAEAIARWTLLTGNLPPAPVQLNRNGNPQVTAAFPAWLMGLPNGYLTNPNLGLTRTEIIKLAGNGVVPQAALVAYSLIEERVKDSPCA